MEEKLKHSQFQVPLGFTQSQSPPHGYVAPQPPPPCKHYIINNIARDHINVNYLTAPPSVGYTTLVHCTEMLEIALHEDKAATHFLHVNGLITQGTYDSVSDPRSTTLNPMEKASLLVRDVKLKVRLNPENYHVLIRYFSENRATARTF